MAIFQYFRPADKPIETYLYANTQNSSMKGFVRGSSANRGQVTSTTETSLYQVVRYKGIFDLDELYKIVHDWLTSRGYQVHEHKYKSIILPAGGKERSFDWDTFRPVTEFIMFRINIHWQIQDVIDVEVVKDGKKQKLHKGRLMMRVQHRVEMDWNERMAYKEWHQSIVKFLKGFMYRKKIDTLWEDKLRFKCYELVNVIKESLDMMTKGNEHYDVW
jgi:hypothetical protein